MAKTKIYIYGASGHGKVVADIARDNGYDEILFLDDKNGTKFSADLPKFPLIVAIGDSKIRQNLQKKVETAGFEIVSLIHSSAVISPSAKIGKGVVIMPNAVVNADSVIKDGAILNSSCVVEHDCVVGEFSHICPRSAIAGNTQIGARVWLGIGSSVIQSVGIGDDTFIGAGSVVVGDIPSSYLVYGMPAKVVKKLD